MEKNAPKLNSSDIFLSQRILACAASCVVSVCMAIVILEHSLRDRFDYSFLQVVSLIAIATVFYPAVRSLWFRYAVSRMNEYPPWFRVVWHSGALVIGGLLTLAIPIEPPVSYADPVALGFVVLIVSVWLAARPAIVSDSRVSRWAWLGYALPPAVYWSYYLWVFWPGLITPDSVAQWYQMTTGQYSDDHPAFHTMCNWLVTRIGHSPAAIAFTQIVLLSLVIGLSLAWLRRHGMPRWLAILATCLLAFVPCNAVLAVTLWKDIPYSTAFLALVVMLLACVRTDGQWLTQRLSWLWLALTGVMVYLCRHNGFPVVVAVFTVLPMLYWRQWRPILLSVVVCGACIGIIRGPVYHFAQVRPVGNWLKSLSYLHHIAAHVEAKTPLRTDEREFLNRCIPFARNGDSWHYVPEEVYNTETAAGIDFKVISANLPELNRIAFALALRNPTVTLKHLRDSSRIVWQIRYSPTCTCGVVFRGRQMMRFDPGLLQVPFHEVTYDFQPAKRRPPPGLESSLDKKWYWLAWRPALLMYLFLGGCLIAGIRARNPKYFLVALPVLVQAGVMALLSVSPDFRYYWGFYLAGILLSGYLCVATPLGTGRLRRGVDADRGENEFVDPTDPSNAKGHPTHRGAPPPPTTRRRSERLPATRSTGPQAS